MIPLIISCQNQDTLNHFLYEEGYLEKIYREIAPTEGKSVGIDEIKNFNDFTQFSSGSGEHQVFLIRDSHLLTPIAQNSLLKTLEESRPGYQFILTTHNHHLLLPTIINRCRVIQLNTDTSSISSTSKIILTTMTKSVGDCLNLTDEIVKNDPKHAINQVIRFLSQANRQIPTIKRTKILDLAITCLSDLNSNVNSKLALDHFFIRANSIIKS